MIIRFGNYTFYEGYELKFFELRHEAPYPFTHFNLYYDNENDCPIAGFIKSNHGGFYKTLEKKFLKNAFKVYTKALYRGVEFTTHTYYSELKCINLNTYDEKVGNELRFIKLIDSKGVDYYSNEIKLQEIEKLWEERKPSEYDLPMPEGLKEYEEIEIPR